MKRFQFYAGLFLITAATLMLQIIETRTLSVTHWYHLAFFVISIAMFGLTVGAVWVYLEPARFTPARLSYHLSVSTLAFALATAAGLLVQMTLATGPTTSLVGTLVWAELALCLAIPFFFSGVAVSLALTRSPYPIGRVYAVDLLGAATGCLAVLLVLNLTSGPAAVLWVAVLIAGSALLFAGSGLGAIPESPSFVGRLFRHRWAVFAALSLLAIGSDLTGEGVRPLLVKGQPEAQETFAFEGWNSFSRVTATESVAGIPALWGPSPRMPNYRVEQRWMTIDGDAGTGMYRFDGDLEDLSFLRYDVTNLVYAMPGLETGAVIGVGGGRDVLSARLFGVDEVVGVEINPIFIDLLTKRFADYTAISRVPGVAFEVDEARSWFARTDRKFDVIQMSLVDTWAATGAGAFTLSENGLYTVEAWRIFLDHLNPDGVFTVSRWYAPEAVAETGRMVSLAVGTLLDLGVPEPRRHLFLASAGKIATLVVARSPLEAAALRALHRAAEDHDFAILLSPDIPAASPVLRDIVAVPDRAALDAAAQDSFLDLTPPTDARPFFFNQLKVDRIFDAGVTTLLRQPGVVSGNLAAVHTLAILVLNFVCMLAATVVIPLRSTIRDAGRRLTIGGTIYFLLIGVGFMMAEIALLQRMSIFLGHPVYALSVVLFSLILATGLGSLASERVPLDSPPKLMAWSVMTGTYLFALPAWLPQILLELDGFGLLVRAGFCVVVLAPAGFLMGFGFPTGMRIVSQVDKGPTPWFWGINGAAGVLAASLAVFISIAFSIDHTLRAGAICYLLLSGPGLLLASRKATVARAAAAV